MEPDFAETLRRCNEISNKPTLSGADLVEKAGSWNGSHALASPRNGKQTSCLEGVLGADTEIEVALQGNAGQVRDGVLRLLRQVGMIGLPGAGIFCLGERRGGSAHDDQPCDGPRG
jgi:hypothetical protein